MVETQSGTGISRFGAGGKAKTVDTEVDRYNQRRKHAKHKVESVDGDSRRTFSVDAEVDLYNQEAAARKTQGGVSRRR